MLGPEEIADGRLAYPGLSVGISFDQLIAVS
jgi:hypothetical protein